MALILTMVSLIIKAVGLGTAVSMVFSAAVLRWHSENPSTDFPVAPIGGRLSLLRAASPAWLGLQLVSEGVLVWTGWHLVVLSLQGFRTLGMVPGTSLWVACVAFLVAGAAALLRARWNVGSRLFLRPETLPKLVVLLWFAPGLATIPAAAARLMTAFG